MKELNTNEIQEVNGAIWANVVGAVVGAIGGGLAAITAKGNQATGSDILGGAVAGGVAGAVSPVSSVGRAVATIGGAAAGGGAAGDLGRHSDRWMFQTFSRAY
ncbi:hypothetical protein L3V43_14355 [Pseudoalteromonas sp. L23]|uniref:hypothetical protein n=1 Tax=unclassified Pseudoalteromonas TaxID=194690 RepID=UPI001EF0B070|nr:MULTISPECIES: hypothetical protein [unclassified Pseudoalteromonas]MCF7514779.1 hypothetical protein [Pseudoalteromonas sp. L7]MCF7526821.1 hypothetical protein [Pseudoalteromonas sp. L23]MCG7556398.1 hypothetical protein [Pseudoalteromonas sp. Of11M-6]MCX2769764.1 hypothetical protein [Pseudoalteromonas sp. B530]